MEPVALIRLSLIEEYTERLRVSTVADTVGLDGTVADCRVPWESIKELRLRLIIWELLLTVACA